MSVIKAALTITRRRWLVIHHLCLSQVALMWVLGMVLVVGPPRAVHADFCSDECDPRCGGGFEYDVTEFGALPGGDDDTLEIQTALNCAEQCDNYCRGAVVVPAGTYEIGKALEIGSGVVLRGQGMNVSVLRCARTEQEAPWTVLRNKGQGAAGPDQDIHIRDLTFEGGLAPVPYQMVNASAGIAFQRVHGFTITRCEFRYFGGGGLSLGHDTHDGLVDSCYSHENCMQGFYVSRPPCCCCTTSPGSDPYKSNLCSEYAECKVEGGAATRCQECDAPCEERLDSDQQPTDTYKCNSDQDLCEHQWLACWMFYDNGPVSPSEMRFVNCRAWGNRHVGFALFDAERITQIGCTATDNGKHDRYPDNLPDDTCPTDYACTHQTGCDGVKSGFSAETARYVTYVGCIADGNHRGFDSWGSGAGEIARALAYSGCIASNNRGEGFAFHAAEGVALHGCHARANGHCFWGNLSDGNGCPTAGIELVGNSTADVAYFSIVGGSISDNGAEGVFAQRALIGTVAKAAIMNNGTDAWTEADTKTGVHFFAIRARDITVSGCTIGDSRVPVEQQHAILAEQVLNQAGLHAFFNEVSQNSAVRPIDLGDCDDLGDCQAAHNPGQ